MKAIRMHEVGPPEVLKYEDCPDPTPGPGEALINVQAVGVNYTDVNTRSGGSPPANLPMTPGREAAGVVGAVGQGVSTVKVGDVVGFCGMTGSYAEKVAVPASMLVKMPGGADARTGAAALLQGMTAHYLAFSICPLGSDDIALVHAGAGGTGLLLIQMVKRTGARVLATVSTDEKAALATGAGADKAIIYSRDDFEQKVKDETDGQGVRMVFDSVGKTTFEKSLSCLNRRGYMVSYGQASGPAPSISRGSLGKSSYMTCPTLGDYTATREELEWRAGEVLGWIASGELKLRIGGEFPLSDAATAHRQLQGRETTGKLLLIP